MSHAEQNLVSAFYSFREKPRSTTIPLRDSHNFIRSSADSSSRKSNTESMRIYSQTPKMKSIIKLPEVSPKIMHKDEHDQIINLAYRSVKNSKKYANEKGTQ